MEQMRTIVQASAVYRALAALCLWFGGQWRGSGLIQWFIHPPLQLERAESDHSVFARLWQWVHGGCAACTRPCAWTGCLRAAFFKNAGCGRGGGRAGPHHPHHGGAGTGAGQRLFPAAEPDEGQRAEVVLRPNEPLSLAVRGHLSGGDLVLRDPGGQPAGRCADRGLHPLCHHSGKFHHHPAAAGHPAAPAGDGGDGGGPVRHLPVPVRLGLSVRRLGGQ